MKKLTATIAAAMLGVLLVGCGGTTAPSRRELLGSWVSTDIPGITIRMTLAETARAVEGAGSWLTAQNAFPFGVSGALARDEVSLLLEFSGREDLNFQGFFQDDDILDGRLSGGEFRDRAITFKREELRR